jgi:hypothetical protein
MFYIFKKLECPQDIANIQTSYFYWQISIRATKICWSERMNRRKWKERGGEMMDDLPLLDSQESGNIMYRELR